MSKNKLNHLKLWESFEYEEVNPDMDNIQHEGDFTIVRTTAPSSYEDEPDDVTYTMTLNNGLNVGNNFLDEHFISALKERDDAMEITNAISSMETEALVVINAKGNYGGVSERWVVDEFPFWEEEDLPQPDNDYDDGYDY